ncbi:MAG TPA: response regulator, partial [bacterium]|nr:response regulator [bacterium]
DGTDAIRAYTAARDAGVPYDVVIMDLTIPGGMGGKETIKKLLEIDPNVRAVVSSGYSNDPIMADHKSYGFKGYIIKPFQVDAFRQLIHDVINDKNE